MFRLLARTWEWNGERWRLVLDHVFYGETREEAAHYMESHTKADAFLRECLASERFASGRIECHTETRWLE